MVLMSLAPLITVAFPSHQPYLLDRLWALTAFEYPHIENQLRTQSLTMPDEHTTSEFARRGTLSALTDDGNNNNYNEWATKSRHSLKTWGLWKYIEGPHSIAPVIPPLREAKEITAPDKDGVSHTVFLGDNSEIHQKKTEEAEPWTEANDLVLSKIINATPHSQLHLVESTPYARIAWERLESAYRPHNSLRATSLKKDITNLRCTPDMDIGQWLHTVKELYSTLCCMDRDRLSEQEFIVIVLDNMPETDTWTDFLSGLRTRISDYKNATPPKPITALEFITRIREEHWHRTRGNPSTQAFSVHNDGKRNKKRPSGPSSTNSSTSDLPPAKRQRAALVCTNQYCKTGKGHTFEECMAYRGGSQGRYGDWWRGPWNIHLPPEQRTKDNNVPPPSHPAAARSSTKPPSSTTMLPVIHYSTAPQPPAAVPPLMTYPQPVVNYSATPHPVVHQPYYYPSTPIPSTNPPLYSPVGPMTTVAMTRADTTHNLFTTDDQSAIHLATTNETPYHAWNALLEGEAIVATLPVLEHFMPRSDTCHHDSGANRHVFHDKTAFETYESIRPVAVKGFGHNLSTAAIGRGTVRIHGRFGTQITPLLLKHALHIPAARSNLISGPQLDLAGITSVLGNGLANLYHHGRIVIGGALYDNMYRLNMSIIRPTTSRPLSARISPPSLLSRISPLAAAASSDQAGFYIA
jgi:gag-polypeptide of LTR copia-type